MSKLLYTSTLDPRTEQIVTEISGDIDSRAEQERVLGLPTLSGSEKQIAYAGDIRMKAIR